MRRIKLIALVVLSFSIALAGFPVQASAPCPMMQKMGMAMKAGQPCHCPCCDKDGSGKSCADKGCTSMNNAGSSLFLPAATVQATLNASVVERFYDNSPSLVSYLLLTQDRPPKQFS